MIIEKLKNWNIHIEENITKMLILYFSSVSIFLLFFCYVFGRYHYFALSLICYAILIFISFASIFPTIIVHIIS